MTLQEMILAQQAHFEMLQTAFGITICISLVLFLALMLALAKLKRYENIYGPLDTENRED